MKFKVGKRNNCIPDGEYDAIVNEIRRIQTYRRPALEFHFEIADGEHRGTELKGFCNADYESFTNRTKLYQWYEKVTGDSLEADSMLDTDQFKEKVLQVRVESKTSKKTGNKFSNVVEILGVKCEL